METNYTRFELSNAAFPVLKDETSASNKIANREEWLAKHISGAYAIGITVRNGVVDAELMTKQRIQGEISWEGCVHNPFTGTPTQVAAEIARRVAYRKSKGYL